MRIEYDEEPKIKVLLGNLSNGDVFYVAENGNESSALSALYMKAEGNYIDVVNLTDGSTGRFGSDTEVVRVNAILKVKIK